MRLRSSVSAPLYVGTILLFTSFSSYMLLKVNELSENPFLSVSIIQLFVFLLPTAFYCAVGKISFTDSIKIRFSISAVPLLLIGTAVYFLGTAIMKYIGFYFLDGAYVNTPGVISASVYGSDDIPLIICMAILPAVLEEMVFRGILLEEYRSYGEVTAVLMTSLCFTMIHFSLENFLYYLFAGVIFGIITFATDSCVPAIILHTLNNVISLKLEDAYISYIEQLGGKMLFIFLAVTLFLILLAVMFARVEKMYLKKAEKNSAEKRIALVNEAMLLNEGKRKKTGDYFVRRKAEESKEKQEADKGVSESHRFSEAFLSPTFFLIVVFFMINAAELI